MSRIWLQLFDNNSSFGKHNRYICNEITNPGIENKSAKDNETAGNTRQCNPDEQTYL